MRARLVAAGVVAAVALTGGAWAAVTRDGGAAEKPAPSPQSSFADAAREAGCDCTGAARARERVQNGLARPRQDGVVLRATP